MFREAMRNEEEATKLIETLSDEQLLRVIGMDCEMTEKLVNHERIVELISRVDEISLSSYHICGQFESSLFLSKCVTQRKFANVDLYGIVKPGSDSKFGTICSFLSSLNQPVRVNLSWNDFTCDQLRDLLDSCGAWLSKIPQALCRARLWVASICWSRVVLRPQAHTL